MAALLLSEPALTPLYSGHTNAYLVTWQGHWIAAIGQLPVMVKGAIACNDFIVASVTDPPMGQSLNSVTSPMAKQPVVAFCLESKESEAPGKVMAFVLFALPAILQLVQVRLHCSSVVLFAAKWQHVVQLKCILLLIYQDAMCSLFCSCSSA